MAKLYREEAVVLRSYKLAEADRILTLLTKEHGKVRAVAKGVRRTSSKFGARLEPLMQVDLMLHTGRNLDTITQVETIAAFSKELGRDYTLYTTAAALAETADKLVEAEHEPAIAQYQLLVGALGALVRHDYSAGLILDSYLLRALGIAGWEVACIDCAVCGAPGPHRSFHIAQGGAVCLNCRMPGAAAPAPQTLVLMQGLLRGDWAQVGQSTAGQQREATGLIAAYSQFHLERKLKSLPIVDREVWEQTNAPEEQRLEGNDSPDAGESS